MISIVARVIYIPSLEVNKEELFFFSQNPNQNLLVSVFLNTRVKGTQGSFCLHFFGEFTSLAS